MTHQSSRLQSMQQQGLGVGLQLMREPYRATDAQFAQFVRGVDAVLNQWTALHLVAQHCDAMALQAMYGDLISWFQTDGEVYSDELEIFFENFFTEARSVVIEDDSMKEVGDVLHEMYCRCCQNDFSVVERYLASWEVYRQVNPVRLSISGGDADDVELNGNQGMNIGGEAVLPDEDGDEELAPQPQKINNKTKKKKNAYDRDNDGWCVVRN